MTLPHTLLRSHLTVAHYYWKAIVMPGDTVIDATCGNGQDTLYMAKLALTADSGAVFGLDIQSQAIEKTRLLLEANLSSSYCNRILLFQRSHITFPKEILPKSVKLIAYNLGYLPGGDKSLTTMAESTVRSLMHAQELLKEDGIISVTCYPGHPQGKIEEEAIMKYVSSLAPRSWTCTHLSWINRQHAPSLLFIGSSHFLS